MGELDTTIPGGYYIGADGRPIDANGKPIVEAEPTAGVQPEVENKSEATEPEKAEPPASEPEAQPAKKAKAK